MTSLHLKLSAIKIAALIALCALAAGTASADGVGVLLAPAGEHLTEPEALYADAIVVGLATAGRRATLLHPSSPMVRAASVALPSVRADDDWTPLAGVLDRIAGQLRLDYVLLTALRSGPDGATASGLLVVRGGESAALPEVQAPTGADAATIVAQRLSAAVEGLPGPREVPDEPVPLAPAPPAAPVADEPAVDQPPVLAPPAAPVAVADEPEAPGDEPAAAAPQPVDDALAEAEAAYNSGELDNAARLLEVSLREAGPSARAFYLRARISIGRQDRDAAISDLRRAVTMDSTFTDAQVWLGRLLVDQGLWQAAQEQYERAVATDPTHLDGLLGLARLYRDHGHRRKAIDLLMKADDLGQGDATLLMLLAELHSDEGNVELAERYLTRVAGATGGEQRALAWEQLGNLYLQLRRNREALTCFIKAAELSPSRATMAQRRYLEVMDAADGTVEEAITSGWGVFEDFAMSGIGARETAYRTLSQINGEVEEALRFAESISPPGELGEIHGKRKFAYALAVEASVLALSWLDLGDQVVLERAREVHADAVRQFEQLRVAVQG